MKPYYQVALFFAVTQMLGIFSGVVLIRNALAIPEIRELSVAPMPEPDDPLNAVFFILYILLGAGLVLLFARFYKGAMFFRLLELAVVASASAIVFFTVGLAIIGLGFYQSLFFGGVAAVSLAALKFFWAEAKNLAAIISSAGVGALFGFSLGFIPAVLFILLLSIYDYVAVFKTKHMITMARELSTRQLSFAVTAKQVPKRMPHEKRIDYVDRAMREGERLDLGTGDLSVPVMISVSAYPLGPNGLFYSLAIALGSTVSLILLLRFVSKQRVFLPALPPICLGGMLAFLAAKLAGL